MKTINLMVSTDIEGKGGVATVLQTYRDSGFIESNNIKLIATHSSNLRFGAVGGIALYILALVKIVTYIMFYNVGLVHIHMSSRGSYTRKSLVVRLVKKLGSKVILHLHGAEFRDFYANECSSKKQAHIRRTFEICDQVIVLSSQWIDWAKQTLGRHEHVCVIYNAVPMLDIEDRQRRLGLVAFLGQIGKRKGVLDVIQAFAQVKLACPHAVLQLAGDGDIDLYKHEASVLGISNSVEFLGWVSGESKIQLLASADIYCLPSYNEGFPMGVLEAMANNVAVVSTRVGGIPDAITSGIDGTLIDAGDVDALASALIELITNRELNDAYVSAAKKKFDQCFSLDAVMPQLSELYKKVLAGGE